MWEQDGTLWVYTGPKWKSAAPLAMFDFDSTLHVYRGRGPDTRISIELLRRLTHFNVVIISNRGKAGFDALIDLRNYVAALADAGCSVDVYAAAAMDRNRKPQVGAWERLCARRGLASHTRAASFYCGDAAGRAKDFAASDRCFADNIGVRFCVPEQLFGRGNVRGGETSGGFGSPPPPRDAAKSIDAELAAAADPELWRSTLATLEAARAFDVVLMVGSPASGKSYLARRLAAGDDAPVASQDIQGTAARCRAFAAAALAAPGRLIIDNTHRKAAERKAVIDFVRMARPAARVAIVWVTTPKKVCLHLNGLRCDAGTRPLLPTVVFHKFWKYFEPPDAAQGVCSSWAREGAQEMFMLPFAYEPGCVPGRHYY